MAKSFFPNHKGQIRMANSYFSEGSYTRKEAAKIRYSKKERTKKRKNHGILKSIFGKYKRGKYV